MAEHQLTFRELSQQLQEIDKHGHGRGLGHPHLVNLARGRDQPSTRAIDLILKLFTLPPHYFAETRLAAARSRLDPATNGFEAARAEAEIIQNAHPWYPGCAPPGSARVPQRSTCESCGFDPVERYGEGAETLLTTHLGDWTGRPMTLCPTCHLAEHLGLGPGGGPPPMAMPQLPDNVPPEELIDHPEARSRT
jgi:hypothetical protein